MKHFLKLCYLIHSKNNLNRKRRRALIKTYPIRAVYSMGPSLTITTIRKERERSAAVVKKNKKIYEATKKQMKKRTAHIKRLCKKTGMRTEWSGHGAIKGIRDRNKPEIFFSARDIELIAVDYILLYGG